MNNSKNDMKNESEEILFMDEIKNDDGVEGVDEVSQPLTPLTYTRIRTAPAQTIAALRNGDAIALRIGEPRSEGSQSAQAQSLANHRTESMLEKTDPADNPQPTYGPEIDDLLPNSDPAFVSTRIGDETPGIDDGIDDGLLPGPSSVSPFGSRPHLGRGDFPITPLQPIPDVNVYQHKKTLAQGMMDLALLSANANQLRYVLQTDGRHPYYYPSLVMIGASLLLQIAVGIGLIWNSRYNVKDDAQMCKANKANNWTVIGIFLVTIFNVFISSFGVVDQAAPPPLAS